MSEVVDTTKYTFRADLSRLWPTDSERFVSALAKYAANDLHIKCVRVGTVIYYNRKMSKVKAACLRAYAHGLAHANYDSE